MADFLYNISKGTLKAIADRINSNDPTNSAIVIIPVDVAAVTDATLKDLDTFSAITTAGVTERSTSGWGRKTLTDASSITVTVDDTNDRVDVDIPDQTWTAVTAGAVTDLIVCYDSDTTAGTDANLVPISQHDFAITPDGSDVVAQIATAGIWRAA